MGLLADTEGLDPPLPGAGSGVLDGPWDQAFWFELPGAPRSKSNRRRFDRSDKQAMAAYRAEKKWSAHVKDIALRTCPCDWVQGSSADDLAARPQVVAVVLARTTLDATNIPKSLHDAVEGVVFRNDASVRGAVQQTVRGRTGAGGVVAFARLPADATAGQVNEAVLALTSAVFLECAALVDGMLDDDDDGV